MPPGCRIRPLSDDRSAKIGGYAKIFDGTNNGRSCSARSQFDRLPENAKPALLTRTLDLHPFLRPGARGILFAGIGLFEIAGKSPIGAAPPRLP